MYVLYVYIYVCVCVCCVCVCVCKNMQVWTLYISIISTAIDTTGYLNTMNALPIIPTTTYDCAMNAQPPLQLARPPDGNGPKTEGIHQS